VEIEQSLDAGPKEDQRIERAQQRGAAVPAGHRPARPQVSRRRPAVDVDPFDLAGGYQRGDRRFDLLG
jgi:hypothetical protein